VHPASLLAASACLLSLSAAAVAAQQHKLDLPAGRLGDAVVALGQQARISIGVRDPALASIRVKRVRGALSVERALERMLAGTPARAVPIGRDAWVIVRAPKPPRPRPASRPSPPPAPRVQTVAQLPPAEEQPDIIVTASKRRVLLAAYPGAATLVDGRDPVFDGLRGTDALAEKVPALTSTHLGSGRNKLFIRGIADSSFNGPTQATVGQYLGEVRLNYNAPDPDLRLYDIDRVEILAGPQGTLYGAGSLGGVIRTVPNAPLLDRLEGAASVGGSVTQHGAPGADAAAMLNVPLSADRIGLRLVGYAESEGGYIDDLERGLRDVNRTRIFGGRAALRVETESGWQFDVGGATQRIDGEDSQFADRDQPPLTRRSKVPQDFGSDYALAQFAAARNWGDLRLVSTFGLVRQKLVEQYDSTREGGPPTLFEQTSRISMVSTETRLSSDGADGTGWLVGASLISNRSEQERALGDPAAPVPITGVRNSVQEATLFGEATLKPAESLSLTAGGRLTRSHLTGAAVDAPVALRALIAPLEADRKETSFLPSLALTARASPELLFFLRYQQGFRPGGLAVTGDIIQRFRNDRVATGEAGFRYRRGGLGGFDAAASVAYTRWRDIQADIIDFSGFPTTQNIGDGRIWTLDLRLGWRPLPGLSLDLGAVLNESRVTNPAPSIIISPRASLPNVAEVNGHFGAAYVTPVAPNLDLRLTASARYVGSSRLGIGPILGEPQGDWLDTRLGARLEWDRHSLSLILSNALDETGNRFALGSPFTLVERRQVTPLRPRTLRLGWDFRF
jgi:iron complex outermembrane receptor protein